MTFRQSQVDKIVEAMKETDHASGSKYARAFSAFSRAEDNASPEEREAAKKILIDPPWNPSRKKR